MRGQRLFHAVALSACAHLLLLSLAFPSEPMQDPHEIGSGSAGGGLKVRLHSAYSAASEQETTPFNDWMDRVGIQVPNLAWFEAPKYWTSWSLAKGGSRELPEDRARILKQEPQHEEFLKAENLDRRPVATDAPDFARLGARLESLKPFRLRIYIGKEGLVKQVEVLEASPEDLETIDSVRDILGGLHFKPGLLGAQPVASYQDFEFATEVVKPQPLDMEPMPVVRGKAEGAFTSSVSGH